jgi:hypothetical protein
MLFPIYLCPLFKIIQNNNRISGHLFVSKLLKVCLGESCAKPKTPKTSVISKRQKSMNKMEESIPKNGEKLNGQRGPLQGNGKLFALLVVLNSGFGMPYQIE